MLGLCAAPSLAAAAPTAPPTPSVTATTSVTAEQAQQAKTAADRRVAEIRARITAATKRLGELSAAAERAEADYAAQLQVQASAQAAANAAKSALELAEKDYALARTALERLAVTNYMTGGGLDSLLASSAASLLVADNPSAVLAAATYRDLAGRYQAQVTGSMADAVAAKSAAEAENAKALQTVAAQTVKLSEIRKRASDAVTKSRQQLKAMREDMRAAQVTQAQADTLLSAFLGGWSVADPARAAAINERYRKLAEKAKSLPLAPSKGKWTPAIGQTAADLAIQWIGTPYAWAGGDKNGPTRGVCAAGDAAADCYVIGFDCSGLVLYAWGPYVPMAHFAATQYSIGKVHPAVNKLLPGDLVFWSSDGTVGGIHHVALYLGQGYVVQAPQSGDIVRITPLANVSDGYFGATRPLT